MTIINYIDLSMPIALEMPTNEPDHFPPTLRQYSQIASKGWAGTAITIDSHCGTHVDAPSHFIAGGSGVDRIPIDVLLGSAEKVTTEGVRIDAGQVAHVTSQRVVLHTGSSRRSGDAEYFTASAHLSAEAAWQLVHSGVRLVGIDGPSVDAPGSDEVHRILLGNGVIIIENLTNTEDLPKTFDLIVSPLRIVDCDGSPARVIAATRGLQA